MKIIGQIPLWMLLCLFALSHTTELVYTAALPDISSYFNISGGVAQVSSSIYFLGFALGILSLGRVSDIFGRRPVVLGGMTLYLMSIICSIFVSDIQTLMVLRFTTAFGASVGSVIGQAMARDSYEGAALSYVYASVSMWLALAPSLGSAIGGYVVEYFGWRYIFVFLSMVSCSLLLSYIKYLPETNPYIGVAQRSKYSMVFKVVIRDRIVLLYAFIIGAFNGMAFGFYMEAPFVFINKIGMLPSQYGCLAFLLSFAMAFGSFNGKYWINKGVGGTKIMVIGLFLSIVGCGLLIISSYLILDKTTKYFVILIIFMPMVLHMIGHGLLMPMTLRYALEDYAKVTGTAGSIFGSLYYLLVAIISFTVSKLHSEDINKFSILLFSLSACCSLSFYLIQRWSLNKQKYNFN
ncbi:Bcr/CflA family efflux MFS transporter [Candidatus Trichorickettsia mobilis]|uniref:Bcr/CflA family efflux transporter n=1 Tax=Candidatus Trichorickettsia mobilis TaxID=1346319 RepID=A0ABZ0USW1_9RICK|nr:Bcr/CflA family efflux MFS transporter [Candidatus Trichorickettsia mobilis]WPY01114.1 Bcr/CflA family efflux MFS transporter [Candidatus Trichorickettsia mobilis]